MTGQTLLHKSQLKKILKGHQCPAVKSTRRKCGYWKIQKSQEQGFPAGQTVIQVDTDIVTAGYYALLKQIAEHVE